MRSPNGHIVFYDGDCGLCHRAVRFLLSTDKQRLFYYAPLSGITAKKKLGELFSREPDLDSMVFLEDREGKQRIFVRSQAVLRCAWYLGGFWKVLGALSWFPPWLFDWAYCLVAQNRKRLFAPPEDCPLPSAESRDLFLP